MIKTLFPSYYKFCLENKIEIETEIDLNDRKIDMEVESDVDWSINIEQDDNEDLIAGLPTLEKRKTTRKGAKTKYWSWPYTGHYIGYGQGHSYEMINKKEGDVYNYADDVDPPETDYNSELDYDFDYGDGGDLYGGGEGGGGDGGGGE